MGRGYRKSNGGAGLRSPDSTESKRTYLSAADPGWEPSHPSFQKIDSEQGSYFQGNRMRLYKDRDGKWRFNGSIEEELARRLLESSDWHRASGGFFLDGSMYEKKDGDQLHQAPSGNWSIQMDLTNDEATSIGDSGSLHQVFQDDRMGPDWVPGSPVVGSDGERIVPDESGTYDVGNDVSLAANLLARGCRVQLDQEDTVSILIDDLKERITKVEEDSFQNWRQEKGLPDSAESRKAWKDDPDAMSGAPSINLCDIYVPDTNLFCVDNVGKPRIEMPQLEARVPEGSKADVELPKNSNGEADGTGLFLERLQAAGHEVTSEVVPASHLRATQSELDGSKVGGIMLGLRSDRVDEETGKTLMEEFQSHPGIIVTRDGYILDGHHRWAALVGVDAADGKLGDVEIPVRRVDISITDLLDEANSFCQEYGIAAQSMDARSVGKR